MSYGIGGIRILVLFLIGTISPVLAFAGPASCRHVFHQLQKIFETHETLDIGVDIDNTLVDGTQAVSTHILPQVIREIAPLLTPAQHAALEFFLHHMNPRALPTEYTPDAWQHEPWNFPVHAIPPGLDAYFALTPQPSLEALWYHMSDRYDKLIDQGYPFSYIAPVISLLRRLKRWKPTRWTFITARQSHLETPTRKQILGTGLLKRSDSFDLKMGSSTPTRTSYDRALRKAQQVLDTPLDIFIDDNTHYLSVIAHLLSQKPFPKLLQVIRDPQTHVHQVRFYSP